MPPKIITDAQALARFDRLITRAKAEAARKAKREATCTSSASKPSPSTVSAAA